MPIERIDRAMVEAGPDRSPERLPKFSETVRGDGSGKSGRAVSLGDRIVDLNHDALLDRRGVVISLRPRAWLVLRFLAQRAGRLVEKNELLEEVWADCVVTEDSLVQAIGDIRRALGDRQSREAFCRQRVRTGRTRWCACDGIWQHAAVLCSWAGRDRQDHASGTPKE